MVPYFPFLEAAYMAKMCGGKAEELFDRIAGLPAVFAFDVADGWRCELCVDSGNPVDSFPKTILHRAGLDNWSEEFPNTIICGIVTDAYYIRIFKNSEYKFAVSLFESRTEYWYAANLTAIGDKMKTIEKKHSNFSIRSVNQDNSNKLLPQRINIGITEKTTITDSSGEIISETTADTYMPIGYGYICKGDMDMNAYAEYVLATRKFSDEFNGISSTT